MDRFSYFSFCILAENTTAFVALSAFSEMSRWREWSHRCHLKTSNTKMKGTGALGIMVNEMIGWPWTEATGLMSLGIEGYSNFCYILTPTSIIAKFWDSWPLFVSCKTEKWHNNYIFVVQTPLSQAIMGTLLSLVSVVAGGIFEYEEESVYNGWRKTPAERVCWSSN